MTHKRHDCVVWPETRDDMDVVGEYCCFMDMDAQAVCGLLHNLTNDRSISTG